MANFGDTTIIDNSNPFNALLEFREAVLEPVRLTLTGRRKEWVEKFLVQNQKGERGYATASQMDLHPVELQMVLDATTGKPIKREGWEDVHDPRSIRMVNDKGAEFIVSELSKMFNSKSLFANISKDEAVDIAADGVDRAFSYIIFNEYEYEVADTTQLITYASDLQDSLLLFLSALTEGDTREALVAILTGGGIQVKKDETPQAPGMLDDLKSRLGMAGQQR